MFKLSSVLYYPFLLEGPLGQQSPTFLPPGTGVMEDNFSTDGDGGWGDGSGGNVRNWER